MANKGVRTKRDNELMKRLAAHLKHIFRIEEVPMAALGFLCNVTATTLNRMRRGENYMIVSMLRAADTLGYELAFVKREDKQHLHDNPEAVHRLAQYRDFMKKAQRRSRGYTDGLLPTRIKIKTPKNNDAYLTIYSKRNQLNAATRQQDNFLDND